MKRICVYSGSSVGNSPAYSNAAVNLGKILADSGIELVYGGSKTGLMGKIADSVLENGGRAVGVMPIGLFRGEVVHTGLSELLSVKDMHERKAKMMELSDGFIALPGGFGTFEEIFETVSWLQLGIHQKPIGLLDIRGYYQPLMAMVRHALEAEFIHHGQDRLLVMDEEPEQLVAKLRQFRRTGALKKWNVN